MAASDETYNLFRSLVVSDFSTTDIDATTLALGREGQNALVFKTAAALAKRPAFLQGIDPDLRPAAVSLAKEWQAEAERQEYIEYGRLASFDAVGRTMRFKS